MTKNKNDLKLYETTLVVFTLQICNNLSHEYVHLVSSITYTCPLNMHTEALELLHFETNKPIVHYLKYYFKNQD